MPLLSGRQCCKKGHQPDMAGYGMGQGKSGHFLVVAPELEGWADWKGGDGKEVSRHQPPPGAPP